MANVLGSTCIDGGIGLFNTAATKIHILSADPVVYADIATFTLGNQVFTPPGSPAFAAPVNGDVSGRKVMSTAIAAGTVTGTGTAAKWAVEDGTHLMANGSLSASQAVTAGNTFTLSSFKIEVPNQ